MSQEERTLVLLKPDAVARGLIGEILGRFEKRGLTVVALKMMPPDRGRLEQLYSVHKGKPFYSELLDFMSEGPIIAMVLRGPSSVSVVRSMVGATKFSEASPGTIRGDLALSTTKNLVHAADSTETAEEEIRVFFEDNEIVSWDSPISKDLY